jgi:hypothetical protein
MKTILISLSFELALMIRTEKIGFMSLINCPISQGSIPKISIRPLRQPYLDSL